MLYRLALIGYAKSGIGAKRQGSFFGCGSQRPLADVAIQVSKVCSDGDPMAALKSRETISGKADAQGKLLGEVFTRRSAAAWL